MKSRPIRSFMWRAMLYFSRSDRSSTPIFESSSGVRSASSSPALAIALTLSCCWVSSVISRVRAIRWVRSLAASKTGVTVTRRYRLPLIFMTVLAGPREATALVNGQGSGPWISASASTW